MYVRMHVIELSLELKGIYSSSRIANYMYVHNNYYSQSQGIYVHTFYTKTVTLYQTKPLC